MRAKLATLLVLLLLSDAVCAHGTNLRIGAHQWFSAIDGRLRYLNNNPANDIDLNSDLGYDHTSPAHYYLRLDHPVPLLPNVMLSNTVIDENASGRLTRTVDFGGSSFTTGEDVDSTMQLRQSDVILYYSILDTSASVDVGVNARYIDGHTTINGSSSGMETVNVSGWLPMLYAGIDIDVPLTGLSVGADGLFSGYRGSRLYDVTVHASYTTPWKVGADLGYRQMKIDVDDFDDYTANVKFAGPYAGVFVNF